MTYANGNLQASRLNILILALVVVVAVLILQFFMGKASYRDNGGILSVTSLPASNSKESTPLDEAKAPDSAQRIPVWQEKEGS